MIIKSSVVVMLMLALVGTASAQASARQAKERSHVHRFSTPEDKADHDEIAASARLAANPNDDQALNARAIARMRLGRHNGAYEDLRRAITLKPADSDYQANLGYALWKLGRPD